MTRRGVCCSLLAVLLCLLAGCGAGPATPAAAGAGPSTVRLSPSPSPSARPSLPSLPSVPAPPAPSASPSPSFAEGYAVACAGNPSFGRVVALLRRKRVIGASGSPIATVGPLCAGGWQYTVLAEPGREPLQVVTQGVPSALQLVTAGTYVCTPLVRTQAPAGILSVAHC